MPATLRSKHARFWHDDGLGSFVLDRESARGRFQCTNEFPLLPPREARRSGNWRYDSVQRVITYTYHNMANPSALDTDMSVVSDSWSRSENAAGAPVPRPSAPLPAPTAMPGRGPYSNGLVPERNGCVTDPDCWQMQCRASSPLLAPMLAARHSSATRRLLTASFS